MEWESVSSSNIDAVAYDGTNMYVRFRNGAEWEYFAVPENEYVACRDASSVGSYFYTNIRGRYAENKVG